MITQDIKEPKRLGSIKRSGRDFGAGGRSRGIEGKILTAQYARENNIPYLGICLGMQVAFIEYARNVAGLTQANSSEFDKNCPQPVIALITEWQDAEGNIETRSDNSDLGGTMRLSAQQCHLAEGSLARQLMAKKLSKSATVTATKLTTGYARKSKLPA